MRRQAFHIRALFFSLAMLGVAVNSSTLMADEVIRPNRPVVREILVPFKDLDVVLQHQARRVFVDRANYERLIRQSEKTPDRRAPQATAIVAASYQATLTDGRARISGSVVIDVLADGLHAVPLELAGLGIQQALLDGRPAALGRRTSGQPLLFVKGEGRHELELEMVAPVNTTAAEQSMTFLLPRAGASRMALSVPGNIEIKSGADVTRRAVDEDAGVTRFELLLPPGQTTLAMSLNNRMVRAGRVVLASSVLVDELTEAYERLHVTASMDVLHGATDRFRFLVPEGFEITGVLADDLLRWEVSVADEGRVLEVLLREPSSQQVVLNVAAMKSATTPDAWAMPTLTPLDVAGDTTVVGILAEERYRLQTMTHAGLIPIDTQVLTDALPQSVYESEPGAPRVRAVAAFYAPQRDFDLSAEFEKPPARVRVSTNLLLILSDIRQQVRGGFSLIAEAEDIFECDFSVPAGWEVLEVTYQDGQQLQYERYVGEAGRQRIHVRLPRGVPPGEAYSIYFHAVRVPDDWLGNWRQRKVEFPLFQVQDASRDVGALAVQAQDDLAVRPERLTGLAPLDETKKPDYGLAGVRTDLVFRYEEESPNATLLVERTQPRITARTFSFLTLNRDNIAAHYELIFDVSEARTRRLSLSLPADTPDEIALTGLDGVQVKEFSSRIEDRRRIWTAELVEPRRGTIRLAVDFTNRRATRLGTEFDLPLVRATDVAYQSGVVSVEGSAELEVELKKHPRRVDVGELVDANYQPGRRLLGVFGYTGEAAASTAIATSHPGYALPAALVERAELTTVVSANGVSQTAARFLLRTKSLFVEVVLPEGSDLWSVQLDGIPAKPQREGDRLLLSLPSDSAGPRDLQLVYETSIASMNLWGRVQVPAPQLLLRDTAGGPGRPLPMADLKWRLHLPTGYELVDSDGTVFTTTEARRPLPITRVARMLFFSPGLPLQAAREAAQDSQSYSHADGSAGGGGEITSAAPSSYYANDDVSVDRPQTTAEPDEELQPAVTPAPNDSGPPTDAPRPAPQEAMPVPAVVVDRSESMSGEDHPDSAAKGKLLTRDWALEGLSSLKIDIQANDRATAAIDFASLGVHPALDVTVVDQRRVRMFSWGVALLIVLIGAMLLWRGPVAQAKYIALIVVVTTLLPLLTGWTGQLADMLDMACFAACMLAPFYLLAALLRWVSGLVRGDSGPQIVATAALVTLLIVSLTSSGIAAEPKDEESPFVIRVEPPAPAVAIPEDAVVIPYDPEEELGPQRNGRLLVPYDRYVDLWNRANPDKQLEQPQLPAEFGLAGAEFRTRLDGDKYLVVEGHIDVDVYAEGVVTVPLQLDGGVLAAADIAGKPARLQVLQMQPATVAKALPAAADATPQLINPQQMRQRDVGSQGVGMAPAPSGSIVALYLSGPGQQRLNLAVRFPLERRGGWRVAHGRLPSAPATKLTLVAPQAETEVRLTDMLDRHTYETEAANQEITTALRLDGSFRMQWRPKIAEAMVDRSLTANSLALFDVQEDSLRIAWQLDLEFRRGQRDAFAVGVPQNYLVEKVNGPNVRGWELNDDGNELEVTLLKAARDHEQFVVYLSRRGAVGEGDLAEFDVPALHVPDAVLHRGQFGIRRSPMIELRTLDTAGVTRTDQMGTTAQLERLSVSASPLGIRGYQAYRFASFPFTVRLAAAPRGSETTATVQSLLRVAEQQRQVESQIHLQVAGRPVYQIRVAIPGELEIRNVSSETWSVTQVGPRKVLNVYLAEGVDDRYALVLSGQWGESGPVDAVALPQLEVLGVQRQAGDIVVQADPALEIRAIDLENCETALLERAFGWLAPEHRSVARLAIQYSQPDYSGALTITARRPQVTCTAVTNVRITEQSLEETIYLAYRISDAGIRSVAFQLPESMRDARISAPLLRQKTISEVEGDAGRIQITLDLQDEVMGEFRILIQNDRLPAQGKYSAPLTEVLGARAARQFVVVETAGRDEVVFDSTQGLLPLSRQQSDWKMLATLLPGGITRAFFLEADPSHAELVLHSEGRAAVETAGARIELAETVLILDANGGYRGVQVYHMDNSTEQSLGVLLPEGATLWTAQVAGAAVKPTLAPAGVVGEVRIPLVKTAAGDANFPVVLKYGGQIAPLGNMARVDFPLLHTTNVNVELSQVRLRLPDDYAWFDFDGTMRLVEDEADLLAGVVSYYNKQIKKFSAIHRGSNPFASVRAKSNLKQLEMELEELQLDDSRYSGNSRLQKELKANDAAWSKAQEQIAREPQQQQAETDNRRQLNELFEGQSFDRAKNIVNELDSNFDGTATTETYTEKGEAKAGRFNKDWIQGNKLDNATQPGNQPQSRVITKPDYKLKPNQSSPGDRSGKAPQEQPRSQPAVPQVPRQQALDPFGETGRDLNDAAERSRERTSSLGQVKRYAEQVEMQQRGGQQQSTGGYYRTPSRNDGGPIRGAQGQRQSRPGRDAQVILPPNIGDLSTSYGAGLGPGMARQPSAAMTQGLASLDVEFPKRGVEYMLTTPRGDLAVTARAVAQPVIGRATQAGWALGGLLLIGVVYAAIRRCSAGTSIGRTAATLLTVGGILFLLLGLVWPLALAAVVAGIVQHIQLSVQARQATTA